MKKRVRGVAAAVTAAAFLLPAAGWAQSQSNGSSVERPLLQDFAPQGTAIAQSRTWTAGGRTYAAAATKWSPTQPTPWLIVAKRTGAGLWDPLLAAQTQRAFSIRQFLIGPRTAGGTAVSASFVVDAATGLMSNVYTVWVTPHSARIVADVPGVVGLTSLRAQGRTVRIDGLNLQAAEFWNGADWSTQYAPLRTILSGAGLAVDFVMGWTQAGGREIKKISIAGPAVLRAKVGDSLAFVPLNSQAADHMLGSRGELGSFAGISVYAAPPHTPLKLYQAAQEFANPVRLTQPGVWTFGIVPPGYRSLAPNAQVATVAVDVTR